MTAQLQPPPGPSEPGDADPGRAAFFQSIGAVGFSYGRPGIAPPAHSPPLGTRISEMVETLRLGMTARIRAALPGSRGAIASALITGMRVGIEDDDEAALRDAGLAHVLAIAGLHMALVGWGLFWLVRAILAAFPPVALNYPIKKYAAAVALAGAAFYLLISGPTASATRAFVMLAMMLVAVLLDRPALSMLAGIVFALLAPRPDILVAPDARTIALRGDDGVLHFPRKPKDRYAAANWLGRDGDSRDLAQAVGLGRCDALGCVATVKGMIIAMPLRTEARTDDCNRAALVIGGSGDCLGPKLVLDSAAIAKGGGYAVTLSSGLSATSVNAWRGQRPWVNTAE